MLYDFMSGPFLRPNVRYVLSKQVPLADVDGQPLAAIVVQDSPAQKISLMGVEFELPARHYMLVHPDNERVFRQVCKANGLEPILINQREGHNDGDTTVGGDVGVDGVEPRPVV